MPRISLILGFLFVLATGCDPDDDFIPTNPMDDDDDDNVIDYGDVTLEPTGFLTAWVRWDTSVPSDSVVEFGINDLEYRVSDSELVTEHELLVAGLRADTTYVMRAASSVDNSLYFEEPDIEFTNDPLPDWLPLETVFNEDVHDSSATERGWTVCNIAVLQEDASMVTGPVTVVVLDHEGQPIWYYRQEADIPATADIEATWDGDGILVGGGLAENKSPFKLNLAGEVIWTDDFVQPFPMNEGYMHHVYYRNDHGNLVSMLVSYANGLTDKIVEYDASMAEVWSWDSAELIPEYSENPDLSNVAIVDHEEGAAYYGLRDESMLYKIDLETGEVIWEFGMNHSTGDLGDFAGEFGHPRAWPMMPHGMEHDGDRWIFYDNRSDLTGSRVVEYKIDEQTMETNIIWEYPGDYVNDPWYAYVWGDVDWTENGNALVTTGQSWAVEPSSTQHELNSAWAESGHARLFELAPVTGEEGQRRIVWEIALEGDITGSYAADRFPAQVEYL